MGLGLGQVEVLAEQRGANEVSGRENIRSWGVWPIHEGELSTNSDFFFVISTVTCHHKMAVVEVVKGEKVITRPVFVAYLWREKFHDP